MARIFGLLAVAVLAMGLMVGSPTKARAETWFFTFNVIITNIIDEAERALAAGYEILGENGPYLPDNFDITLKVDFEAPGFIETSGVLENYGYQVELYNPGRLEDLLSSIGSAGGVLGIFRYGDYDERVHITSIRIGNNGSHYIQFMDASGRLQEISENDAFGRLELVAYDATTGKTTEITGTPYLTSKYVTPEPATMLLFGSGLAGLAWYKRRKTRP